MCFKDNDNTGIADWRPLMVVLNRVMDLDLCAEAGTAAKVFGRAGPASIMQRII